MTREDAVERAARFFGKRPWWLENMVDAILESGQGDKDSEPDYEWGVRWNGTETVAHSEHMARKWVAEDPEGTVLLKRTVAGPWSEA